MLVHASFEICEMIFSVVDFFFHVGASFHITKVLFLEFGLTGCDGCVNDTCREGTARAASPWARTLHRDVVQTLFIFFSSLSLSVICSSVLV